MHIYSVHVIILSYQICSVSLISNCSKQAADPICL